MKRFVNEKKQNHYNVWVGKKVVVLMWTSSFGGKLIQIMYQIWKSTLYSSEPSREQRKNYTLDDRRIQIDSQLAEQSLTSTNLY